jgi:hypothetical protein
MGKLTLVGQAVPLHQREPVGVSLPQRLAQQPAQRRVQLAGDNLAPAFEEFGGQGARARADLENKVPLAHARRVHQAPDQVVVDQEVLPERLLRGEPARLEQ